MAFELLRYTFPGPTMLVSIMPSPAIKFLNILNLLVFRPFVGTHICRSPAPR